MCADDLALVASSPGDLQAMLDLIHRCARKWHYELNEKKSVVMVSGEAAVTTKRERANMIWFLGDVALREVDELHNLGIFCCVSSSTMSRTNERATACRSAFFCPQFGWIAIWMSSPSHLSQTIPSSVLSHSVVRLSDLDLHKIGAPVLRKSTARSAMDHSGTTSEMPHPLALPSCLVPVPLKTASCRDHLAL